MEQNSNWKKELATHQIEKVEFHSFRGLYPRLHGKNAVKSYHGFGGSVSVAVLYTNQGAMGWGELSASLQQSQEAAEVLVGRSLTDIFDPGIGILDDRLHAFDIPLHDLAGVILQIPVCRMIEPDAVNWAGVYDGAIYMNDIIPEGKPYGVSRVLEECQADWELGYRTLKIKIGRGHRWMEHEAGMKRDIDLVRSIHKLLPGAGIMVDANDGYSFEDAVAFLDGIGDCRLYWFEEPFRECEENNRKLRTYLDRYRPGTLIADGESRTDIDLLRSLARKKLVDVWQPDVCGFGFTPWRKLMKEIVANGWLASPHAWGDAVKTNYCAHLAAAYPHHVPCVEAVLGNSEGIDTSGYQVKDGILSVPDKPGFGMSFDWLE